jgi:hypothetical protein
LEEEVSQGKWTPSQALDQLFKWRRVYSTCLVLP